jgi:hypothetical protein
VIGRLAALLGWAVVIISGQDPFSAGGGHYKLLLDNDWVRVSRVSYGPHETAPVHDHPSIPTVYVYLTDGGPMLFKHTGFRAMERPPVKAGGIRFNRGNVETHEVEYLGDTATEYLRVELKTEPPDRPSRDARIAPDDRKPFEDAQLRIVRDTCGTRQHCEAATTPALIISLQDRSIKWLQNSGDSFENAEESPAELIRIELKSKPRAANP